MEAEGKLLGVEGAPTSIVMENSLATTILREGKLK
jgi:hypothetical protein